MGCIVKIKAKNEYRVFDTEAEARQFIKDNGISIETFTSTKDGTPSLYIKTSDSQETTLNVIRAANQQSWEDTKDTITTTELSGWDTEEYSNTSSAISLSKAMSSIRVMVNGEVKRLFPEFITNNYLNVLVQSYIIESYLESQGKEASEEEILNLRTVYFDNTLPDDIRGDGKLRSAEYWYKHFKKQINDSTFTLSESDFASFNQAAQDVNNENFESMLRGEVMHKIFELVIKWKDLPTRKGKIYQEVLKLVETFKEKYGDKYSEVPDSLRIIDNLVNGTDTKLSLEKIFDSYYNQVVKAKKEIEESFTGATNISWLAEQRITADLSAPIDGKSKIRGKIDAIIVVDGVPHIIDLKVSKNSVNNWPSEKLLKTKYQLGMYWRLLNKIGLNTNNSSLDIYSIALDPTGKPVSGVRKSFTTEVKTDPTINKNIDSFLEKRVEDVKVNAIQQEVLQKNIAELFGETSEKGRSKMSLENTKDTLRKRAQQALRDGKKTFTYHTCNENGTAKSETITVPLTKENLETVVEQAAVLIEDRLNNRFGNLYNTFLNDIREYLTRTDKEIHDFVSANNNADLINQYSALLLKYKGTGARLIESEIARQYNLIIIETPIGIDIIDCTALDPTAPWNVTDKNELLFSKIPGSVSKNIKTVGNVEIMKSLLIANDLLQGSTKKLDSVTCIRLGSATGYIMTQNDMVNNAAIAFNYLKIQNNLTKDRFVDPFAHVLYMFNQFVDTNKQIQQAGISIKKSSLKSLSKESPDLLEQVLTKKTEIGVIKEVAEAYQTRSKIEYLKSIREQLRDAFPTLFNNPGQIRVISPETVLMNAIEQAIAKLEGREMVCESDISIYGINSGAMMASLDLIPSANVGVVRQLINAAFSKVGDRFADYKAVCRKMREDLEKANNYGTMRAMFVGDRSTIYFNLFRKDSDGNYEDDDFILKNPWDPNVASKLKKEEIAFIKFMLFYMNKYKYKWKNINEMKPEQLKKTDYCIPLVRARGFDRIMDPKGGINFPSFRSWITEVKNEAVQMKDTLEGQIQERKRRSDEFKGVYNEFSTRTDPNVRKDLIDRNGGLKAFSRDLETVLDTFIIAMESEEVFNTEVIPEVQNSLYTVNFQSMITGQSMPKFEEFVKKQVKSTIYNDSIMDPEVQKFYRAVAPLRSAVSTVTLGFGFINVPREVLMGFFTNISRAMFGAYGKETFTAAEYMHALGIMCADVPRFIHNVTKIELLNEHFRMANMSITEIPEQATSNKTGVWATFSRFMSWSLTAPDYWNRMSMFIAQMLHDGVWDAYTLEKDKDGVQRLVYDMKKDKRFDLLVQYKGDVSKVPAHLREKYKQQLGLYEAMREDMNKERTYDDQIPEVTKDKVVYFTKAYTNLQRDSFKSFADMSFGYYDKETKAWFFKTAVGGIFKMFMAYLSAKKMSYFQVRSDQTARGSYEQLTDATGNKLWSVVDTDENGSAYAIIVNDNDLNNKYTHLKDTAVPKLGWTGTYMEGIIQSYLHLIKDIGIGTKEALRNGDTTVFKKIWKEYGKKGDIRHSNVLQGLWDLLIAYLIMTMVRAMFFNDPEVTGISYDSQLRNADFGVQNMYYILNQATGDFSFIALLKQGIKWDIPMITIPQNWARNFMRAAGDDDLSLTEFMLQGTVNSVGLLKPLRPWADSWGR